MSTLNNVFINSSMQRASLGTNEIQSSFKIRLILMMTKFVCYKMTLCSTDCF